MIILKVTEKQVLTLFLEDTFLKKPQEGGGEIDPVSVFRVKKNESQNKVYWVSQKKDWISDFIIIFLYV